MDVQWVKLTSWHVLRPYDHFGPTTFCGRSAEGLELAPLLIGAEKSCESCLRILAQRVADAK